MKKPKILLQDFVAEDAAGMVSCIFEEYGKSYFLPAFYQFAARSVSKKYCILQYWAYWAHRYYGLSGKYSHRKKGWKKDGFP